MRCFIEARKTRGGEGWGGAGREFSAGQGLVGVVGRLHQLAIQHVLEALAVAGPKR
jgi:hypothetical protein